MKTGAAALLVIVSLFVGLRSEAVSFLTTLFSSPIPITIAVSSHFGSALTVVARQEGYYKANGVDATVVLRTSGKVALAEVMQGRADFAVVAESPLVRSALAGDKPAILAGIAFVDGHHTIIAPKSGGMRSARDLPGKRVGIARGTSSEFFLERVLRYHALPLNSVVRVSVDPEKMHQALKDGRVDAVCTWKPWEFTSKDTVRVPGDGIYTWHLFLVTRQETADLKPELCRRVVAALVKAEAYSVRHRRELPRRLAPEYGMDVKSFEAYWAAVRLNVSLDHSMVRSLEEETRWVVGPASGAPQQMPNYLDLFFFEPLEKVRPSAVTIVHRGGKL